MYGKHEELASRLATALRRESRMSPEQERERDAQLAELAMQQVPQVLGFYISILKLVEWPVSRFLGFRF